MTTFFQNKNGSASGVIPAEDMPVSDMIEIPDPQDPEKTIEVLDTDKELRKLARKITDEYHLAIGTSIQQVRPINPAIYNNAMNPAKEAIFLAILGVLKVMHSDKGPKPSIPLMLPIGAAVVAYWTAAMVPGAFSPLPMPLAPPYTTPTPGVLVLFPGNPKPIAKGFKDAFSKYDNERDFNIATSKMLDDIIKGFKDHLASISGIYVGLVPAGPVFIPTPISWKGITV